MKMFIAEEMSKEPDSSQKPAGVVARLMGLDVLPAEQPILTPERSLSSKGYLLSSPAKPVSVIKCRKGNGFQDKQMSSAIFFPHSFNNQESHESKDVHEVHQSSKNTRTKDQLQQKRSFHENKIETLVRLKFNEAKRLATDEKLRQSKEFQDALEVLNSNRDLFLKCLQEPNSLLSKQLNELQSIPPPSESKRITVLKPSKAVEVKGGKPIMIQHQSVALNEGNGNKSNWISAIGHLRADKSSSQPTRIVVLKPSPGKTQDIKAPGSSPSSSPRLLHSGRDFHDFDIDVVKGSREIAKEITQQMQENMSSRRDESLHSSVLSNGYMGDESSFNKSESQHIEKENLSDLDIGLPSSKHSWDYVDKCNSPFSSSSISRVSYSPESYVSREAKKRLLERWAMTTSTASGQDTGQIRKISSTLGEMLALPGKKKPIRCSEEGKHGFPNISFQSSCNEQELEAPPSCLSNNIIKDKSMEDSPKNILSLRPVPLSSTAYENVDLNNVRPDPKVGKSVDPKEATKQKSGKSSLKGKVSSLFFSRNKRQSKDKPSVTSSVGSENLSQFPNPKRPMSSEIDGDRNSISDCVIGSGLERRSLCLGESLCGVTSPASVLLGQNLGFPSSEESLSQVKPKVPEHSCESHDQPSPVSVLEASFEDDVSTPESFGNINSQSTSHFHLLKSSEATARSPLIESITRSLSWDDPTLGISASSNPLPPNIASPLEADEEEEQRWFQFVQILLSAAGLDHDKSDTLCARRHSSEIPLNPSLLDKCAYWKEDTEGLSEAKRRLSRSYKRLIFDSVNAALVDIIGSISDAKKGMAASHKTVLPDVSVTDMVWDRIRKWSFDEAMHCEDSDNGELVEMVARKEVVGRLWVETWRWEVDGIGEEVEKLMLEELVDETLSEVLTCVL